MKQWMKKLRARRGETLVETLCALLVIVLSSGILAVMISAGTRLNATAITADAAYYEELNRAEARESGGTVGTVKATLDGGETEYTARYYGGSGDLTSYGLDPGQGGG